METMHRCVLTYVLLFAATAGALGSAAAGNLNVENHWGKQGRIVVQNDHFALTFDRGQSSIVWTDRTNDPPLHDIALSPVMDGQRSSPVLDALKIDRPSEERAVCELVWSVDKQAIRLVLDISADGIVRMHSPAEGLAVDVTIPIRYGVLANRHLDDVVYDPTQTKAPRIHVPATHLAMGLVEGGREIVACGWAGGANRHVSFSADRPGNTEGRYTSMRVGTNEHAVFLKRLAASSLWTSAPLSNELKGKRIDLDFEIPFKARWQAQLPEAGVPTTYPFRTLKGKLSRILRPYVGNFVYPFHIDGDKIVMRYPGRFPAKGEILIYALEGHPETPYGAMRLAFDKEALKSVPEMKRTERTGTLFSSGSGGTVFHPACVGRDQMRETHFKTGSQDRVAPFIAAYSVDRHERATIAELQNRRYERWLETFETDLAAWRKEAADKPDARAFLDNMSKRLEKLKRVFVTEMDNMTSAERIERVERLRNRLCELAQEPGEEVYPEIRYVLDMMNSSQSTQEALGRRFGTVVRDLAQAAARESATAPAAIPYARKIRRSIQELLSVRRWETPSRVGALVEGGD